MTDLCPICEETLNNLPCTELLCHHKYHTECFLAHAATGAQPLYNIECPACYEPLLPVADPYEHEPGGPATAAMSETQMLNAFDTNEQFRQDLKAYVKATEASSKPRRAFQKLITTKKNELKELAAPLLNQVKVMYAAKRDELLTSEQFKDFKKAEAKWRRLYSNLRTLYQVDRYSIRALRVRPGMHRLHAPSWYSRSPNRMVGGALSRSLGCFSRMRL
jgi:hypothetical protein